MGEGSSPSTTRQSRRVQALPGSPARVGGSASTHAAQHPAYLVSTQHHREALRTRLQDQVQRRWPASAEGVDVEEPDAVQGNIVGVACYLPLILQIEKIVAHLLVTELVWWPTVVLC